MPSTNTHWVRHMVNLEQFIEALALKALYLPDIDELAITSIDINRPGLQFFGFFDYFPRERLQIIGKAEMTYLMQLNPEERRQRLERYMVYNPPCIIISRSMPCPEELMDAARAHRVPLFSSAMVTTKVTTIAIGWLSNVLAPKITMHGVLIDVDGVGLLLTGENGIGKSESALEMVKRGHALVADDAVEIRRVSENRLVGEAPPHVRNFMEIRGVGLIDVRAMFGVSAIIYTKSIDLNIHMEFWEKDKHYDRLGLKEDYTNILDVNVPKLLIPVRPGRNLAITLEVAAKNHRLKTLGYNAAKELERRVEEQIMRNSTSL